MTLFTAGWLLVGLILIWLSVGAWRRRKSQKKAIQGLVSAFTPPPPPVQKPRRLQLPDNERTVDILRQWDVLMNSSAKSTTLQQYKFWKAVGEALPETVHGAWHVHAGHGLAQLMFHEGDTPGCGYKD